MIRLEPVNVPRGVYIQFPLSRDLARRNLLVDSQDGLGNKSPDYFCKIVSANGVVVGHMFYDAEDEHRINEQAKAFCDLLTVRYQDHEADPFGDVPF